MNRSSRSKAEQMLKIIQNCEKKNVVTLIVFFVHRCQGNGRITPCTLQRDLPGMCAGMKGWVVLSHKTNMAFLVITK